MFCGVGLNGESQGRVLDKQNLISVLYHIECHVSLVCLLFLCDLL